MKGAAASSETHDPLDANDPIGTGLRGLPCGYMNLAYDAKQMLANSAMTSN